MERLVPFLQDLVSWRICHTSLRWQDRVLGHPYTLEYLRALVWEEVEKALGELPAAQRDVFELTEMEGFTFRELAEDTGIPVATLLSRKHYAIKYLRSRLADIYEAFLTD